MVTMARRWRRRTRGAAPAPRLVQAPGASDRCDGHTDRDPSVPDPSVVDLIDLARPPLKLVPLENLLPSTAPTDPDTEVSDDPRPVRLPPTTG